MASHDRRLTTLRALSTLRAACTTAGIEHDATLFDDGSSDGTATAVERDFPEVTVLSGDGDAFWARSMQLAEASVLSRSDVSDEDRLLWLNDDVSLVPASIRQAWDTSRSAPGAIVVGSTIDPVSEAITYGGLRKRPRHPLAFDLVLPELDDDSPVPVDSFNGNFVMVPVAVARRLGSIDGHFAHAYADIDYGVRASSMDIEVMLLPQPVGLCSRNAPRRHTSIAAAWRAHTSRKGAGHPPSLRHYLRKHRPGDWFLYYAGSVAIWWGRALTRRMTTKSR